MNAAGGEKRGGRRGIEQEEEKTWSEKESARAQVRERASEKERGQRERRGRGVDVDGGAGGRGGGEEVVTRRGRRDESGRSQRPKITAMTFTFSHSPPRVSLVLSPAFFFLSLSVSLPLLSHPPLVLPRFAGDSSSSFSPSRVKMSGCTQGGAVGKSSPMPRDNTVRKIIEVKRRTHTMSHSL